MELLKDTVSEKDFERASQSVLVQVNEKWLTGFGWGRFCVLAATLAFFLGQHKGRTIHSPNSFWRINITEERMKIMFWQLNTFKKKIEVRKLDARISQINVTWNGRDDKP